VIDAVCGADFIATFVGSTLEAPPQHEPDMINLQQFDCMYLHEFIWMRIAVNQDRYAVRQVGMLLFLIQVKDDLIADMY
jgi:hypothetical protein